MKWSKWLNKAFLLSVLLVSCLVIIRGVAPTLKQHYSSSKQLLGSKGELLRLTLSKDDKYRIWTSYNQFPEELLNCFLEKEDRYFYYHLGFNPVSLVRAFFQSYVFRTKMVGGSTITMQLARLHYKLNSRSVIGKLVQIFHSIKLELMYSKKDLMETFLNLVPMGKNIEGATAASTIYFNKKLDRLTPVELKFLSLIPQNPSLLNKHSRYQEIPSLYESKLGQKLWIHSVKELPFSAPHFTTYMLKKYRSKEVIRTTLNLKLQRLAERAIKRYVDRGTSIGIENGSILILDYKNMELLAHVGSVDFYNKKIFGQNDGTLAKRSPGSTLKPFVYGLAISQGLIHPMSVLFDAPLTFRTPENYDGKYLGPLSAEDALVMSRNVPAVYLNSRLKAPNFYEFLKDIDIKMGRKNIYGSSIVLGGLEFSSYELVKSYAMLANLGVSKDIRTFKQTYKQEGRKVLSKEAAILTLDMLSKNRRPDEKNVFDYFVEDYPVFWKTGTSVGYRDGWSVGIVGPYVIAVWIGNFDGSSSPSFVGIKSAAPLFFELVDRIKPHIPDNFIWLPDTKKISEVEVCALSGKIPTKNCKHKKTTLFIPGVSPISECDVHRKFKISARTGLRACIETKGVVKERVYEIWPMPIHNIYKTLKFAHKLPPHFGPECSPVRNSLQSRPLKIVSPKYGYSYNYRVSDSSHKIFFEAWSDSDSKKLFWYIDNEFLGSSTPEYPFFWDATPGNHYLKVVNDKGNLASRNFSVKLIQ